MCVCVSEQVWDPKSLMRRVAVQGGRRAFCYMYDNDLFRWRPFIYIYIYVYNVSKCNDVSFVTWRDGGNWVSNWPRQWVGALCDGLISDEVSFVQVIWLSITYTRCGYKINRDRCCKRFDFEIIKYLDFITIAFITFSLTLKRSLGTNVKTAF